MTCIKQIPAQEICGKAQNTLRLAHNRVTVLEGPSVRLLLYLSVVARVVLYNKCGSSMMDVRRRVSGDIHKACVPCLFSRLFRSCSSPVCIVCAALSMLASSGSVPSSQAAVIATYWTTGYVLVILEYESITIMARLRYSAGCAYIAATSACAS